tara:strand:- start:10890 stop:11078 length:189 start_codon:yes stop_codon:yes gene_type:complete
MSKETREEVERLLEPLSVKYRSGEWYRVDDVRKLLHKIVSDYNRDREFFQMSMKEYLGGEEE